MKEWALNKEKSKRNVEDNITLTIKYKIYKELAQIKLDEDLRTFDDVLEFLLEEHRKV